MHGPSIPQDRQGLLRQRHNVGLPTLHPPSADRIGARNGPQPLLQIDFSPQRTAHLTRPASCKDQKFERKSRERFDGPPSKRSNKGWHLTPCKCCMMRSFAMFCAEFARDADAWICFFTGAAKDCAIEHCVDTLKHPRRRFGLREPNRLQHRHNISSRDLGDWSLANLRKDIAFHRTFPLHDVFTVSQLLATHLEERVERPLEGHDSN